MKDKKTEVKEEKVKAVEKVKETFKTAEAEVTVYGVYNEKGVLVKKFNIVNHSKDFIEIAEAYAKRMGFTAKPYVEPLTPEQLETDVVHVVTSNGEPVRTFSLKVHGEDSEQLAPDFMDKHGKKKKYRLK